MQPLSAEAVQSAVDRALKEDIGPGDATTLATVPAESASVASMVARQSMVVCGLALAEAAFHSLCGDLEITANAADGERVGTGRELLRIEGSTRAILTGERTALNFLQRLSGVSTLTARYVDAISGTSAQILDTRKTTPGWRRLEKYAVACGGGRNHRFGLHDLIMIKDNHLAALRDEAPNAIAAAVQRARAAYPELKVEVEADTLEQVAQAADAGADIVLLDNMPPSLLTEAVKLIAGRAQTEASGGITLETARAAAETGVDFISVGALTHSAQAVDIGLDFAS